MYKDLNIYNELFLSYKEYIQEKSIYAPKVYKKNPQNLATFPTLILKESINANTNNRSTNGMEFIDRLVYTIDIYTKDITIDETRYASNDVMTELKFLTFQFFSSLGMNRLGCDNADYIDITVDRVVVTYECNIQSWNKKII